MMFVVSGRGAVWLACLLWEQEVGGSNPLAPMFLESLENTVFLGFFFVFSPSYTVLYTFGW